MNKNSVLSDPRRGRGAEGHAPNILTDKLNLYQPVGADYAHHITSCLPPFLIFESSYGPGAYNTNIYCCIMKSDNIWQLIEKQFQPNMPWSRKLCKRNYQKVADSYQYEGP